jgi:dipeptidyl aminopeptidase/acylaminoacyl peptidase
MVQEAKGGSLGDTLPRLNPTPTPVVQVNPQSTLATESSQTGINQAASLVGSPQASLSSSPAGTIAFSYLNLAVYPPVYQIHLISPDGNNHRLFPLDGVSEPALRSTTGSYQLAYRAWGQPTSPRSLLSSKLDGERPYRIGGFWEDAQPDWSPTEDRIIFASQRENDRRWRLYTIWGDGQAEVNLRREGKSPTFAPDGFRFAFESCDETGNRCGLWLGDLENSEYGSKPFLLDPLAQAPDWSPTGEEIAYMANPGGNWDLYLVNSNGRNVRRLTDDPSVDGLPAWSPDGEWLAFLSNRDNGWGIWLLHLDSSETRRIFSFDGDVFTPSDGPLYGQRNWWDEQISWSN